MAKQAHGPGMGILRLSAVAGLAVVGSLAPRLRLGSGCMVGSGEGILWLGVLAAPGFARAWTAEAAVAT